MIKVKPLLQKIMSCLTSNDSAYDSVLAKIFNYIAEHEESKLLFEKDCRFDLMSLEGSVRPYTVV